MSCCWAAATASQAWGEAAGQGGSKAIGQLKASLLQQRFSLAGAKFIRLMRRNCDTASAVYGVSFGRSPYNRADSRTRCR